MVHSISNRVVGRMAAVLFLAAGAVSSITSILPIQQEANRMGELVVGVVALAVGIWAWYAPWHRWPRSRSLWLIVPALGTLGATVLTGASENTTFAAYFVVTFVWVGIGHPRWTAITLLPLVVAAYALPLVAVGQASRALDSVFEVTVLCVAIGEALAWVSERLRRAEVADERRTLQMQMLLRAAELLARENEPARLPQLVSELAVQLLRTQAATILLLEGEQTVRPVGALRWTCDRPELTLHRDSPLGRVLNAERVVTLSAGELGDDLGGPAPFPWTLAMPLAGSARPQGMLLAGLDESPRLDEFARDAALTFATQAGLALERVRAAQALLEESLRDELTALGNRRYANLALGDSSEGDAIVVIDLDHFKELNDTRGHAAGDEVLRLLAAHLRGALRERDAAARLGGDEFLLVLREIGDNAATAIDRLEQQWRAASPTVTYSAGIAMRRGDETPEQTLARADTALYAAKHDGRDHVALAS